MRGEIVLEKADKKKNPYTVNQDSLIEYLDALPTKLAELKNTGEALRSLEDGEVSHLAYVYLYCSIKRGICKEVIDAVLEIDIANAALEGAASCPTMKRFWKVWIENDMEKRHRA